MFLHNFKYSFKILFRNKMLIFWTFAFPIILGTFFNLAFSNIENSEKLDIIDIAIVDNEELKKNGLIKKPFETLSDEENEDRLFNTQYVTEEKAKELLEENKITGYLIMQDSKPKVVIKSNGIDETILKYVTEEIMQTEKIMQDIGSKRIENQIKQDMQNGIINEYNQEFYAKIYKDVSDMLEKSEANLNNISNSNLSYTMIEFYTLIAMTCLYGGILGMTVVNNNLANMGEVGKRTSITPTSKGKVILSSLLASYLTQLIGLALLFAYTVFVLKVDYGTNLPLIVLLALVGSLAGLALGIAVATLLKTNENVKTGILIAVTMLGSFLSGMMGITMKYVIDKNVPIINILNPVNMITDGLYALYYYNTLDRYYFNIISLLVFSAIMIILSIRGLRRQRFETL